MSTSKKVLFLITKSNFGGAQKYVYELALATKQQGHHVMVACGGTGEKGAALGLLAEKLQQANIAVVPIKHFMRNMSAYSDVAAFFEIIALLYKERPNVFHVTSSKAGGLGTIAGRLCRIPRIIFTSHGLTVDEVWRPRWQRILIYIGTYITMTAAHVTIMISQETYQRACRIISGKDKVKYIKNGIAPIDFKSSAEARQRLQLNVATEQFLIGGIGELHPNKNWLAAIAALPHLPPSVHLAILGAGEEYELLSRQAESLQVTERVHLLGYIKDAATYLRAFDVFILPSKKEGLPYVLLEAGLAELPVVATDLPGNRDIIDSGSHGLLIEPDYPMIATSVEMLLRDTGMRRRFGTALKQKVTTEFSIERMIDETTALYTVCNSDAS